MEDDVDDNPFDNTICSDDDGGDGGGDDGGGDDGDHCSSSK